MRVLMTILAVVLAAAGLFGTSAAEAGLLGDTITATWSVFGGSVQSKTVTVQNGPDDAFVLVAATIDIESDHFTVRFPFGNHSFGNGPGFALDGISEKITAVAVESNIAGFAENRVSFSDHIVRVNLGALDTTGQSYIVVRVTQENPLITVLGVLDQRLDATTSSRADQATADAIRSRVDGLSTANLDTTMSSRASQTTADAILGRVTGLATGNLDTTVSSRASQATADAILGRVTGLTTGNLDTTVSSRASQASVNALSSKLDAFHLDGVIDHLDLLLRAKIEVALANGTVRVVLFFAPASAGGHLETVRAIVADAIQMARQSGVDPTKALRDLANGDLAYAAGHYLNAYDSFRKAYQNLN